MRSVALALLVACGEPEHDLPRLELFLDPGGLDALEADPRSDLRVRARLVDGDAIHDVTVRYRGDTARNTVKHSWAVDLGPGRTMLDPATGAEVDELNLLSNYFDASQLRAVLAFELLAAAGVPGPRAGLVWLDLGGCPGGVYTSVEEIDRRWLLRVFGEPGDLYGLTRGCVGRMTPETAPCYQRAGEPLADDPLLPMLRELAALGPEDFPAWLERTFDVESLLGWIAVNTAIANDDAYHKNHIVARAGGRWRIVPWDYDLSFGRRYRSGCRYTCNPVDPEVPFDGHRNPLVTGVFAAPALRARLAAKVRALLDGPLAPEAFDARLDALWSRAGPAVRFDPLRRSHDPDQEIATLRRFVRERRAFLERTFF